MSLNLRLLLSLLLCLALTGAAQNTQPPQRQEPNQPAQEEEETVRINTELIQTGVTVLDEHGRFIDGLRQEDFDLRVDGKRFLPPSSSA